MSLQIEAAYDSLEKVKELFIEYQGVIGIDLRFQNFDSELEGLPGKYSYPLGRLYIARFNGELCGCVALRPLDNERCEMKRMYVRPGYRRLGIGRELSERIIRDAREIGYSLIVLDSFNTLMSEAISLYHRLGFSEIPPYYNNPNHEVVFLGLILSHNSNCKH